MTNVWKKHLKTNFQPGFYPGASGRVGYEVYMGKKAPDAYNLLFGNMGPELLNWVVKKPSFPVKDCVYFGKIDNDPACIFVSAKSKFKTIDDIVAEGKKRQLNVGTSRLAHPASIGVLALGREHRRQVQPDPAVGRQEHHRRRPHRRSGFQRPAGLFGGRQRRYDPGAADLRRIQPAARANSTMRRP